MQLKTIAYKFRFLDLLIHSPLTISINSRPDEKYRNSDLRLIRLSKSIKGETKPNRIKILRLTHDIFTRKFSPGLVPKS